MEKIRNYPNGTSFHRFPHYIVSSEHGSFPNKIYKAYYVKGQYEK